MFTAIITWTGALLGIAVLLAMSVGALGIDFDTARVRRQRDRTPLG
ncbi:MAG: hypothetical protein ACRDQW_04750 [Haloechinothrix sp.]